MFWIPITVLVCLIAGIISLCQDARGTKYKTEFAAYQGNAASLASVAEDRAMESELDYTLGYNIDEWKQLVREFMGGNPEWADYVDYSSGKLKAKIVTMVRSGKLPAQCINYGVSLMLADDTRLKPGPHQIQPERGTQMNEDFMLRVAHVLGLRTGMNVTVYVWTTMNGELRTIHMPLLEFQRTYGYGKTHYFTRFQLIAEKG